VANRSPNTRIFLSFVLLEKETGRSVSEHRGDDKADEESIDEKEVSHMTTVESVVTEIGLTHPIVYDFYDLCDYVKKKKLNYFTLSMLKEAVLSSSSHLNRDSKAVLMSKMKEMPQECQCSVKRIITPSSSDAMALDGPCCCL